MGADIVEGANSSVSSAHYQQGCVQHFQFAADKAPAVGQFADMADTLPTAAEHGFAFQFEPIGIIIWLGRDRPCAKEIDIGLRNGCEAGPTVHCNLLMQVAGAVDGGPKNQRSGCCREGIDVAFGDSFRLLSMQTATASRSMSSRASGSFSPFGLVNDAQRHRALQRDIGDQHCTDIRDRAEAHTAHDLALVARACTRSAISEKANCCSASASAFIRRSMPSRRWRSTVDSSNWPTAVFDIRSCMPP